MNKKVLLVDDEANILLSLQFLMKRAGYLVECASDGEEALEKALALAPDLILLDINMPKMNGYAVCEKLRADPQFDHCAIVLLTAKGREVEREKGLAIGADDYITKPFSNAELMNKAAELLAKERNSDASA